MGKIIQFWAKSAEKRTVQKYPTSERIKKVQKKVKFYVNKQQIFSMDSKTKQNWKQSVNLYVKITAWTIYTQKRSKIIGGKIEPFIGRYDFNEKKYDFVHRRMKNIG